MNRKGRLDPSCLLLNCSLSTTFMSFTELSRPLAIVLASSDGQDFHLHNTVLCNETCFGLLRADDNVLNHVNRHAAQSWTAVIGCIVLFIVVLLPTRWAHSIELMLENRWIKKHRKKGKLNILDKKEGSQAWLHVILWLKHVSWSEKNPFLFCVCCSST